jgi:hypothetical protein
VRAELSPGAVVTLEALQGERFVVETVRAGGMGIVAKLVPLRPGRRPKAFKTYQQLVDAKRFEKEVRAWSSLSGHRNIARLDWFGRWQGASATLGAWYPHSLAEASFVADPDKGIELIAGIVKALVHAVDERGILHRDIKPANVLIDDEGAARLGDFGLAAAMAPRGDSITIDALTPSMRSIATIGDIAGTPLYMAPELFAGQQPSVTSELYALGVTIYEFVTGGEHPYLGADTSLQFRPHLREEPLVRLSRSLGPLIDVLPALLALDPRDRPRSVTDVLHALGEGVDRARRRSSFDLATEAATLRRQRQLQAARTLLERGLLEGPGDPVLLNGLAFVLIDQGDHAAAVQALEAATERLILTEGRYEGDCYADPVVNLARDMIRNGSFERAEELLATAEVWLSHSQLLHQKWYAEFGWLYLYRGKFAASCEHFSNSLRTRRTTDIMPLFWFVLAAWLGRQPQRWAGEIARQLHGQVRSWPAGLLALIVSDALPADARDSLMASIPQDVKNDLHALLVEAKVPATMSFPLHSEVVSLVVRSLDNENTGGKFAAKSQPS